MISPMHPVSNDEEATLPVGNRELRVRIFGAGENSYALLAFCSTRFSMLCLLFALLEFLAEQATRKAFSSENKRSSI